MNSSLTMAVLALLREGDRHPYEMQHLLRERNIEAVVKLRGGSLYDAIDRLVRAGLATVAGRVRTGSRPERTIYTITPAGVETLTTIVREHLATVAQEYPAFAAGLAHLLNLDRDEAVGLLHERRSTLTRLFEETDAALQEARKTGVPRLVLLETEYSQLLRQAEITWLREVTGAIETGDMPWIAIPPPHQEA
ncbi:PadR family transcriptional regulator [Paractinoplanes ferrugineus]|uniref:PadR family transcriptional regulator n=1 Tax=Paractinoplanes ferrugineus TaxID=113564 RepID=UPI0031DA4A5A